MCGYCIEINGIDHVVRRELAGEEVFPENDEDWMTRSFLAMESGHLFECFEKVGVLEGRDLADKFLFCRIIEALVEHGFNSEIATKMRYPAGDNSAGSRLSRL
ncbi:MAG: hypothetical protein BA869_04880 [Desulfuromonadales bacterium C00003107]|jgi:hypothetical protein|nr:MAG: hypothetical protein BA869_04880 [Desulfuromonadales bacterium C00003107]